MGRSHAEQLGSLCREGMPLFYHGLMQRILARNPKAWSDRLLVRGIRAVLGPLTNRLLKQLPAGVRDRALGMAEVAGIPEKEVLQALVLPDLMPLIPSLLARFFPGRFVDPVETLRFGCSSFYSPKTGLVGRNLDFPGVGYWDRFPVIQHTQPTTGLHYISFTTAGVPLGGITGINEAGLYVAVHQHFCKRGSLSGSLPFILGEQLLNQAQSLQGALDILDKAKLGGGWAFILVEGTTGKAAVWEGAPGAQGLLRATDKVLAHSNYFETATCKTLEYATSARMNWDNHARAARLREKTEIENLTPRQGCQALSDNFDPFWKEEKVLNRTVSMLYNIQSVLMDSANRHAWIAEGDSPIHLREFTRFDLSAVFAGGDGRTAETLPGCRFENEAVGAAKHELVAGFVEIMDGNEVKGLEGLEKSLDLHFTPEVAQGAALMLMKQGEWVAAQEKLESALTWIETKKTEKGLSKLPPEYFELGLFRARLADLRGDRAEALTHYRAIASSTDLEDSWIRKIAGSEPRYRVADLDRIVMPFSTYSPFV